MTIISSIISNNSETPERKQTTVGRAGKEGDRGSDIAHEICSSEVDKPFTPPPDAEYYINLFADGQSLKTESESDDTASTISTVIDKFSMSSNYSSESDLSSYTSLTNGQSVVINKSELAKVLKPFTMLEQEFNVNVNGNAAVQLEECLKKVVESTGDVMPDLLAGTMTASQVKKPMTFIPGNNYENVEFKTEKVNTYENVELKIQSQGAPIVILPTPKPRQAVAGAGGSPGVEPKKRSIIPTPRKIASPTKLPIQVAPPTVPSEALQAKSLTKAASKVPTTPTMPTTPTTPTNSPLTPANTPTTPSYESTQTAKEFITKIPKAIASVFGPNSQRSFERAKTEGEIKLKQSPELSSSIKQQTAMFLDKECHSSTDSVVSAARMPAAEKPKSVETSKLSPPKSRIPVVLSPKRSFEMDTPFERKLNNSPSNIPRFLTHKQKSETDLKLGLYRSKSKESSPPLSLKMPLQRTNSAESKLKSPERTLIPVFSGQSASAEAILASTAASTPTKAKGPKPKPPERVQSLGKSPTHIPKLQPSTVSGGAGTVTVTVADRNTATTHTTPPSSRSDTPTMQTFKQQSPPASASPNREIRFKIQTYESKTQEPRTPFTDVNDNEDDKMPSLFDLVRKHSPNAQRKDESPPVLSSFKSSTVNQEQQHIESNVDDEDVPPAVVGKCIKVSDSQPTYYSSSSEDDEEELNAMHHDAERDYDCEDGEKLGPPELINGPGPSEAYFNLYWHSNMLPTIGEVEEEFSSLEPQSLPNGPIVIVDDLSQQQQPKQLANNAEAEKIAEPQTKEIVAEVKKDSNATKGIEKVADTGPLKDTKEVIDKVVSERAEKSLERKREEVIKSEPVEKTVKATKLAGTNATESTSTSSQKDQKTPAKTGTFSAPSTQQSATGKARKSQFIGVPVSPPTVPKMESGQVKAEETTSSGDKVTAEKATHATKEMNSEFVAVKENASELDKVTTTAKQVKPSDKITDTANKVTMEVNYQSTDSRVAQRELEQNVVDMPNAKANWAADNGHTNNETIMVNQVSNNTAVMAAVPIEAKQIGQQQANEEHINSSNNTNEAESIKLAHKVEGVDTYTHSESKSETAAETTKSSSNSASSSSMSSKTSETHIEQTVQKNVEAKTEHTSELKSERQTTQKVTTTTTKKQVIKSSTSSTQLIENSSYDALDGLPEELRKTLEAGGKAQTNKTTSATPSAAPFTSNLLEHFNKPVAFTLQPYAERVSSAGSPRITVFEERQFETKQNAYTEIRTRDAAGEEKLQTSTESHKERAKLKKVHSQGDDLDQLGVEGLAEEMTAADNLEPMTVTASAETRISEFVENPQDKQSIERGILNLSESGKQLQRNESGGVEYMECEHQVQDSFEDMEQVLGGGSVEGDKKPTLLRELSETLTVTKDGDKQVTRRSETTKETPKKGAKLLKKSEDERRLELEAQKLIESYQKVKKEAEKLFQHEFCDEEGFDFGDDKQNKAEAAAAVTVEEVNERGVNGTESGAESENLPGVLVEEKLVVESELDVKIKEDGKAHDQLAAPAESTDVELETHKKIDVNEGKLTADRSKLDASQLTAGFLDEERRSVEKENALKEQLVTSAQSQQQQASLHVSAPPDLLDNEPFYVLHKNIIEEPKAEAVHTEFDGKPIAPVVSKVIAIEEAIKPIVVEVKSPQHIRQFETVEIKIEKKLPASINEVTANEKVTIQATKPTSPPIPQKREHKSSEGTIATTVSTTPTSTLAPTPKKRGSIDLHTANFGGDHTPCANSQLQTSKLEIPINTPNLQQNCERMQQPTKSAQSASVPAARSESQQHKLERIIVGVEQQQYDDTNNVKQQAIITFASEDLPTEMAVSSPTKQVVSNVVSGSGSSSGTIAAELHLETINLPNEPQNTSPSTTTEKLRKSERVGDGMQMPKTTTLAAGTATTTASMTFMSTSSSADSVQSVIEVGGIVESPSEDEVSRGVSRNASEEEIFNTCFR
ncbi:serine-rich adhesin for platelets-like [Rhagoletis pomonella]|uniref:serine-rich adhesin for platelets-like n=1 Tax=Rhagoletis pomonella TaxID=28610 RepID=UPI001784801D|nr:serine-rich adhesin for platelets-like [Rhagoletis pomonella]